MNTIWHLTINTVIGYIFLLAIGQFNYIYLLIIILSGFLIDADHYLVWFLFEKKFRFKDTLIAWHKNVKLNYGTHLMFLHTIEVWIIIVILSFIFKFPYILIGMIIHVICDYIGFKFIYKTECAFKWSIIYWYKHGKKNRRIVN